MIHEQPGLQLFPARSVFYYFALAKETILSRQKRDILGDVLFLAKVYKPIGWQEDDRFALRALFTSMVRFAYKSAIDQLSTAKIKTSGLKNKKKLKIETFLNIRLKIETSGGWTIQMILASKMYTAWNKTGFDCTTPEALKISFTCFVGLWWYVNSTYR